MGTVTRSSAIRQAGLTYRQAGVDIEAVDSWLAQLGALIRSTTRPEVLRTRRPFAGLFRLGRGRWRDPVLVASADGVGTKLKLAEPIGAYEAIGIDLVAMNVNDVLVYGAQPILFLDYLAFSALDRPVLNSLVRGMAAGCREAGCALLGGETAQMPWVYQRGEYDVAGFCVGVVERAKLLDGSGVRVGDVVVGLASSGVHANGFSLLRKALPPGALKRLTRSLLTPTRIYVNPVLTARASCSIQAIAHVTGGGLARRLPTLVVGHRGLRVRLHPGSWPLPILFQEIQQAAQLSTKEMFGTFNMGIGMTLVCRAKEAPRLIRVMERFQIPAWTIGTIE